MKTHRRVLRRVKKQRARTEGQSALQIISNTNQRSAVHGIKAPQDLERMFSLKLNKIQRISVIPRQARTQLYEGILLPEFLFYR